MAVFCKMDMCHPRPHHEFMYISLISETKLSTVPKRSYVYLYKRIGDTDHADAAPDDKIKASAIVETSVSLSTVDKRNGSRTRI